jgi:AcrR family transcriptional regulator
MTARDQDAPAPTATAGRILEAAFDEFSEFGFAGARVDRIAERASANVASIYRHFGNKRALHDRVLAVIGAEGSERANAAPDLLGDRLAWFATFLDTPRWRRSIRILLWSQLEGTGPMTPPDPAVARAAVEVRRIVAEQHGGSVDRRLHPGFLYLMETALFSFAYVLRSWASDITGLEPGSAAYDVEARRFFRTLAELLAGPDGPHAPSA